MKIFKLTSIFFLALLCINSCKDDSEEPIEAEQDTVGKVTTLYNLHKKAAGVYQESLKAGGDSIEALNDLGQWLVDQPEVAQAHYVGVNLVEIRLTNGLRTDITLIPVDEDGQHLIRGGGQGTSGLYKFSEDDESPEIKNSKVLVLVPFVDEFYGGRWFKKDQFKGANSHAPQADDVTVIEGKNVTLASLEQIGDPGFVILNTHGLTDGFLLLMNDEGFDLSDTTEFSKSDINDFLIKNNNLPLDKIANGQLRLSAQYAKSTKTGSIIGINSTLTVTEEYVRNMNLDLKGTVLMANHCYSGWVADGKTENNMSEAWLSKGLSTYYGYAYENGGSAAVGNKFCKIMEDSLIMSLVQKVDSTGIAHLKNDVEFNFELIHTRIKRSEVNRAVMLTAGGASSFEYKDVPLYFYQYFDDSYRYIDCKEETLVDTRDGEKYKTVCIGGKLWMAENLRYSGAGICHKNDPAKCRTEGRLYTIFEVVNQNYSDDSTYVQGICPKNWHVPSNKEYEDLIAFCGGENSAVIKLRSKDWPIGPKPTDEFGFNLVPTNPAFVNKGEIVFNPPSGPQTQLWTSSGEFRAGSSDGANIFETRSTSRMHVIGTSALEGAEHYAQCRCVKD